MSPLAIAAINMVTALFRMSSISQNIANTTTNGYKQEVPFGQPFPEVLASTNPVTGRTTTVPVSVTGMNRTTDFAAGSVRYSGNPLDLAIEGPAFFELAGSGGLLYTRAGNFKLDARGRLVTEDGLPVMGLSGDILLTTPQPVIDGNGAVFENGKQVAQLKLVRFDDPRVLRPIGAARFAAGGGAATQIETFPRVRQGFLENSNVNPAREMVRMIETVRLFETNQRLIQAYDDSRDRAIRGLGQ
jgi:flagellar basal-body rod protein FlgG